MEWEQKAPLSTSTPVRGRPVQVVAMSPKPPARNDRNDRTTSEDTTQDTYSTTDQESEVSGLSLMFEPNNAG